LAKEEQAEIGVTHGAQCFWPPPTKTEKSKVLW